MCKKYRLHLIYTENECFLPENEYREGCLLKNILELLQALSYMQGSIPPDVTRIHPQMTECIQSPAL